MLVWKCDNFALVVVRFDKYFDLNNQNWIYGSIDVAGSDVEDAGGDDVDLSRATVCLSWSYDVNHLTEYV